MAANVLRWGCPFDSLASEFDGPDLPRDKLLYEGIARLGIGSRTRSLSLASVRPLSP